MLLRIGDLYNGAKEQTGITMELLAGQSGLNGEAADLRIAEGLQDLCPAAPGELMIVTGEAAAGEALLDMMRAAFAHKACGVAVVMNTDTDTPPNDVVLFCSARSLPLFRVKGHVHLSLLIQYVTCAIAAFRQKKRELSEAMRHAVFFPESEAAYASVLQRYGLGTEQPYSVAVCELTDGDSEADTVRHLYRRAAALAERAMGETASDVVVICTEEQMLCFFAGWEDRQIVGVLERMVTALKAVLVQNVGLYIGMGRSVQGIGNIVHSFKSAVKAARLQRIRAAEGVVMSYSMLRRLNPFLATEDMAAMREFYHESLQPLAVHDADHGTEYVAFLRQYFQYGCHVRAMSQGMYLHRNSINYKLRKIEEILHCDLSDIRTKARLIAALDIMEILEI